MKGLLIHFSAVTKKLVKNPWIRFSSHPTHPAASFSFILMVVKNTYTIPIIIMTTPTTPTTITTIIINPTDSNTWYSIPSPNTRSNITYHRVPIDIRIEIYEYATGNSEYTVHYTPKLWIDTSTSSGRWILAAKVGDLPVLQRLLEYTTTLSENMLSIVKTKYIARILAQGNHFHSLQWAYQQSFPIDEQTLTCAIQSGSLSMIHWLRQIVHCPWDSTCFLAVIQQQQQQSSSSPRWDLLQYLVSNSCPWNHQTFLSAIQYADIPLIIWLKQHGCPYNVHEAYTVATTYKRHDVIQWLQEEEIYHGMNIEHYVLDILPVL